MTFIDITHIFPNLRLEPFGVKAFDDLQVANHGQYRKAITVKVVSRQFDSVRVEQNHCQGLHTVKKS